jgi:hypothetical protein
MKLIETFDRQEQLMSERKRVAWVVVLQCISNFCLASLRIVAFYSTFLYFSKKPALMCYNPFLNFYNSFSYVVQEVFVCINCVIDLFVLTPYRDELMRFWRGEVIRKPMQLVSKLSFSNDRKPEEVYKMEYSKRTMTRKEVNISLK